MDKIDLLYHIWKSGSFNDSDLASLYKFDAESYDYDNHKHNEELEEILNSRNIRSDLAHLLHAPEDQIAFLSERMDSGVKYLYTGLHIIDLDTQEVLNGSANDMRRFIDDEEKIIRAKKEAKIETKEEVKEEIKEEVKEEKETKKENLLERCKKRSILPGYARRPYRPVKKEIEKESVIKRVATPAKYFALASTIVAATAVTPSVLPNNKAVDDFINDYRYIISEEKLRTDDSNGFYYLHGNIAKKILKTEEDDDALIYVTYKEVARDAASFSGYNEDQVDYNMNLIMFDMSLYSDKYDYSTFDEYLESKKCVDENGEANVEVYDKMMKEYITNMVNNNNYTFDGGKVR